MSDLQVFNFDAAAIRTITKSGEPWFVAKDIASTLGYSDPNQAVRLHCKKAENLPVEFTGSLDSRLKVINQSDVLRLIVKSQLPAAEQFESWVFDEVIPQVLNTGSYSAKPQSIGSDYEAQLIGAKYAADMLKLSDSGKIEMLKRACESSGVSTAFLPDYSQSEDNREALPLSRCLNHAGINMSAANFNKLAISAGYMEVATRPSSKGGDKEFKRFTDKGLAYGKNIPNPKNERETSPLWYADTFSGAADLILNGDGKEMAA